MIKMLKTFKQLGLFVLVSSFLGCGYTSDKAIEKKTSLACQLETDKFALMLTQNIKPQIQCLKENFKAFEKNTLRINQNVISKSTLKSFVAQHFKDNYDFMIDLFFQVNALLLSENPESLTDKNLDQLFDILIIFNEKISLIHKTISNNKLSDDQKSQILEKNLIELEAQVKPLIEIRINAKEVFFELGDFLKNSSKALGGLKTNERFDTIILAVKKILLGGEKNRLSTTEFLELLKKLPTLSNLYFNLKKDFNNNSDKKSILDDDLSLNLLKNVKIIRSLLNKNNKFDPIISIKRIVQELESTLSLKEQDLTKFLPTLKLTKKKIIGGEEDILTVLDIDKTLSIVQEVIGWKYFSNITYDANLKIIKLKSKINSLEIKDLPEYAVFDLEKLKKHKEEFTRILKNFRFFRNDKGYQYFGHEIKRTKSGLSELGLIRKVVLYLARGFGHFDPVIGENVLSMEEVNDILVSFRSVLEHFGLWSEFPETFARNTLLLSDLFQYQSDGDLNINADEAAEYGTVALQAIKIGDDLRIELQRYCDREKLAKGSYGYNVECYRKHFFKVVLDEMKMSENFVQLNKYVKSISDKDALEFLTSVEGFARGDIDYSLPIPRRDMILVIGALLNIESTFIRYDSNKNNILDTEELEVGFLVYKNAIIKVGGLDKIKKEFMAKTVFYYMLEKMKKPSAYQTVGAYLNNRFRRNKTKGKRLNIGVLLYYMVKN